MRLFASPRNAALLAAFALAAALAAPTGAKADPSAGAGWRPHADLREDVRDHREDRRDRLEDRADRREDYRDARHDGGWRDRAEDRWDRREDRRDHQEDRWDHREDHWDRNHGRGHAYGFGPRPWSHARLDHREARHDQRPWPHGHGQQHR